MRTFLFAATLFCLPLLGQEPQVQPKAPALPTVDQPAPGFRVNDHEGSAVSVGGKAKTWTVLAFYPKAATPG